MIHDDTTSSTFSNYIYNAARHIHGVQNNTKQYKAKHPALGSMILYDLVDPSPTTAWQTVKAVRYGAHCVASGIASLKANHGRNVGKGE